MKTVVSLTTSFIFFFFSETVYSLYFIENSSHPVLPHEDAGANYDYPEVGQVFFSQNGEGQSGTGTLIAPNVVLSARHVVEVEDQSELKNTEAPAVIVVDINNKMIPVTEKVIFDNSHDIVLLKLRDPVTDIIPREIRQIRNAQEVAHVHMMGFGYGRIIKPSTEKPHKIHPDSYGEKADSAHFRCRRNITGQFNLKKHGRRKRAVLHITTDHVVVGNGDSGGPLLNQDNKLIAIATHSGGYRADQFSFKSEIKPQLLCTLFAQNIMFINFATLNALLSPYFLPHIDAHTRLAGMFLFTLAGCKMVDISMQLMGSSYKSIEDYLFQRFFLKKYIEYVHEINDNTIRDVKEGQWMTSDFLCISPKIEAWIVETVAKWH